MISFPIRTSYCELFGYNKIKFLVQNFPKLKPPWPRESCRGGDRFQWIKAVPAKKDDNPVTLIQVTGGADIADANLHKNQLACIVEHNCFQILCRQTSISSFWVWTIGEETFFGSNNRLTKDKFFGVEQSSGRRHNFLNRTIGRRYRIQSFGADSPLQAMALWMQLWLVAKTEIRFQRRKNAVKTRISSWLCFAYFPFVYL